MDIFLKMKHWQLFLLMFVAPVVIQVTAVVMAITSNDPVIVLRIFPVVLLLYTGSLLSWLWAMGSNLADRLPAGVTMNVNRLKGFLLVPAIYFLLLTMIIQAGASGELEPGYDMIPFYIVGAVLMLLLHLFSVFCIFYSFYFVAKTYRSVRLNREAEFGDYIGEFFLLWFWFVGIWIIQPHINKMFPDKGKAGT